MNKVTKKALYATRTLISIAALLGIDENKLRREHDRYLLEIGGQKQKFNHRRFIKYILTLDW